MKTTKELYDLLPSGLESEEWVRLSILCLDQAGLSSLQQERIRDKVIEHLGSPGWQR